MELNQDLEWLAQVSKDKLPSFFKLARQLKFRSELQIKAVSLAEVISDSIDCTSCGNCCRHSYPVLEEDEIEKISISMDLKTRKFREKYLNRDEDGFEVLGTGICPFLSDNRCEIYSIRPRGCREFPHLKRTNLLDTLEELIPSARVCPIVFHFLSGLETIEQEF